MREYEMQESKEVQFFKNKKTRRKKNHDEKERENMHITLQE